MPTQESRQHKAPYSEEELEIRVYSDADHPEVRDLYHDGHLSGSNDPNDTGADIDNIQDAYMNEGSCFWVAVLRDKGVVGTIGVQRGSDHCAEIRRLRVSPEHRNRGIGTRLMETSISFCKEAGYLKVILDTEPGRAPAISLFKKFGFQLDPTSLNDEARTRDFYLDLYREPDSH